MNKKAIANAGWIIGCKIVKALLSLLVTMLTARYLGVGNYGLINYAAGLVAFASPLMKLGLDSIAVYELVNKKDLQGKTLGTIITLCTASSFLCILGVVAFAAVANHGERETMVVCGLYSTLLIFEAMEMIQFWFHAQLLAKYSSLAMLFSYVIVTVVQSILIYKKASVYWFALSHSIDYLVISIILFLVYKKKKGQRLQFSFEVAKQLLSVSRFYIVSSLMVTIFNNTDRVMLKLMINNEATGIYSAAVTCASVTGFIYTAIMQSMRPLLFESKRKNSELFESEISVLYSGIIYLSLLQCLVMTIFAPQIIRIFYGIKYVGADNALRFVVWFTTFSHIGVIRNIWILAENQQKHLWKINASGAIMNIILNYILIPKYGVLGASVASVISQFFTNVIVGFIIRDIRPNNTLMLKGTNPRLLLRFSSNTLKLLKKK